MDINTLTELSANIKNRTEFLLVNIQDMLVSDLRLDDYDFHIRNCKLVYKNLVIIPKVTNCTVTLLDGESESVIIGDDIKYKDITKRFKEALYGKS